MDIIFFFFPTTSRKQFENMWKHSALPFSVFVGLLFLFSVILGLSVKADNVKLEVYIESGCPVSQAFLLGELTDVLSMEDIVAIVDFKYVPFGNAHFNKTLGTYQCYDDAECETDSAQMCSMVKFNATNTDMDVVVTGENSLNCIPFISCVEANGGNII
jgi:hypothetical protein